MQTDEDVGKVAAPVPVIISRALELFVENLLKKANQVTLERGARTLTPSHLKMCIKSEKRFDFLKELVSTVPDLQGDHDEPLALYQNMTAETQETKSDTSNSSMSQRPKLPRQLSTPRPRGRPRAMSADQDQTIPKILQEQKKRKKKRQPKYMDEDELSDLSNTEEDSNSVGSTSNATSTITATNYKNNSNINNSNAIVTCTVTTGLTSPNGAVNNGSKLGFTISIPSSSFSSISNSPMSSPLVALPMTSSQILQQNQNGISSSTISSSKFSFSRDLSTKTASDAIDSNVHHATAIPPSPIQDIKLALVAHDNQNSVQDVDENYDDC